MVPKTKYFFTAGCSTAGSVAETDEELDDFNDEDQESYNTLYRLVQEESPPRELPKPIRKTSVASAEAR